MGTAVPGDISTKKGSPNIIAIHTQEWLGSVTSDKGTALSPTAVCHLRSSILLETLNFHLATSRKTIPRLTEVGSKIEGKEMRKILSEVKLSTVLAQ